MQIQKMLAILMAAVFSGHASAYTIITDHPDSASEILGMQTSFGTFNVNFTNFITTSFSTALPGGVQFDSSSIAGKDISDSIAALANEGIRYDAYYGASIIAAAIAGTLAAENIHSVSQGGDILIPYASSGGYFSSIRDFQINNGASSSLPSKFVIQDLIPYGVDRTVLGSFAVLTAVPEPESYALALVGLAAIGFTACQSKKP